jgi:hypothetical protein
MSSFLAQLAEKIVHNSDTPLEDTVVVVPNKRAQRELLSELALHFSKPVFVPTIWSVNEFIENISTLNKIENDELLMRLFDIYKKKDLEKNDNFTAFLTWAPLFLNDINEIDLYLANANNIFTNLSEIKELDVIFSKENLTEAQRTYLYFYSQLADLYNDITNSLLADHMGYEGMIYKDAAYSFSFNHKEHKKDHLLSSPKEDNFLDMANNICTPFGNISHTRYIFAGINAATPAELEILRHYYIHKNAEFYFDIDHFYDEKYGIFIQEIRQQFKIPEIHKSNDFKDIPKDVYCYGAPKRTAQIYQAIDILNEIEQKQGDLNDTVLVLADETMLMPFVHTYNTEKANITMGYPLNATLAAQKLMQTIDDEKQNNRLQKSIYHLKTQGFEFLQYLKNQFQTFQNEDNYSENEHAYSIVVSLIEEVIALLSKFFANDTQLDFNVAEYFIKEKLNATSIPFTGNAHDGLKIMGMLETRILDFKNVVILAMNEGILPKGKAAPSMLLYSIRTHFGLPTHQYKDDVFGYHFFRLIQRAQNVFLVYDNDSSNAPAEKSRFVKQLEFEITERNLQESIHFHLPVIDHPFPSGVHETEISIKKTKEMVEKLSNFKFSPTSLITYIKCPLCFYLKYIEEITVSKPFDPMNEKAVIGTVIHKVLEMIFIELQDTPSQFADIISKYQTTIDEILPLVFHAQKEVLDQDITQGKLFLAYKIAQKSILEYLTVIDQEWQNSLFQIIATEITLTANLDIAERQLCMKGTVDRIEVRENKVTILDYKTGKVNAAKLKCNVADFDAILNDPTNTQLFQLLCYAYLYQNTKETSLVSTNELQCGIIAFQELYKQNDNYIQYVKIDKEPLLTKDILLRFENYLKQLLASILDDENQFCQTDDREKNCVYCDYQGICNV